MKFQPPSSRRQFVKWLTFGSVSSMICQPWRGTMLAEVTPSNVGILSVKISDYPPLQNVLGSIRLGLAPLDENDTPLGRILPIIINRDVGDRFYALDSTCRHEGCMVLPYDGEAVVCPCHGSAYALDGAVLAGPTTSPLLRYPVQFDGVDTLRIEIMNLGYQVTATVVTQGNTSRFRLSFPTMASSEYEVRFREKADEDWRVVPFATGADAPAEELSLIGNEQTAVVYVDRTTPTGFYTVALKVLNLTPEAF